MTPTLSDTEVVTVPEEETEQEDEREICYSCDDRIEDGEEQYYDGDYYCSCCYNDRFANCYNCGTTTASRNMYNGDDGNDRCESCHHEYEDEDDEENEDGIPERAWKSESLPEFMSKTNEYGTFIKSNRIFSAEIEAYYPSRDVIRDVANILPRAIGISGDGSLDSRGVEFQTPKLKGKNGEEQLLNMCRVLNSHDFTVNGRAGLHIHIDGKGLLPKTKTKHSPTALKNMIVFYLVYEDVLLSFLPPSRRGNRYADQMSKRYCIDEVIKLKSLEQLEQMWYRETKRKAIKYSKSRKYHDSRYSGVNLHPLLTDGHLEIRYHSGTINSTKILEWCNLHLSVVDLAVAGRLENYNSVLGLNYPNLEEKTDIFFNLLRLGDRSREYFKKRQSIFISSSKGNTEAQSENEICAE